MSPYETPDARPLIPSKTRLPRLDSHTLSRPRLEVTIEHMASMPLGILRAPAGFGKSTLMSYWAHQQVSRIAWYALDDLDNDPALFARYLVETLRAQLPESQQELDRIREVMHLHDLMWLIGKLCNTFNQLEQQISLVLDNYHVITHKKIHDAMSLLLQHQPWSLHVFLITRGELPLGLARLRLKGSIQELKAEALKFTTEEAMQFLTQRISPEPDQTLLRNVLDRLDGWPAGLQIIALSAPTADSISHFLKKFNGTHAHMLDFLAEEILHKQSEHLQNFMLKVSVVDRFNAELATAITGMADSFTSIQTLTKLGLFLTPLDEENQWFRFHPFFAEFLQHELHLKYPRHEIDALHMKAYQWWLHTNVLQDALQHVLQCQDVEQITHTLETHGWTMFEQGHMTLIERGLSLLPNEVVTEHYKLALLKAWVLSTQGDADALQQALTQVERLIPPTNEGNKWRQVSAEIYALKAQMSAAVEEIEAAKLYANHALNDATKKTSNASAVALSVLGEVHVCEGRLSKAIHYFREAEQMARDVHSIQALMWTMAQQSDILFYQGELVESYQHQTTLFQISSEHFLSQIPVMEFVHRRRAELCLEWFQMHEVKQHCEWGLSVIESLESHCQLPLNAILAMTAIHQNKFEEAETRLSTNTRIMKDTVCHTDWVSLAMQAQLFCWARQENTQAIRHWLSQQTIDATVPNHFQQKRGLNIAFAMLSVGYVQPAIGVLQHIVQEAQKRGQKLIEVRARLFLAWAHVERSARSEAIHCLLTSVEMAEPMRLVGSYLMMPESVIALYQDAFQHKTISADVKRHLLRIVELTKRRVQPTLKQQQVPEVVQSFALTAKEWEVLQLIGQGESNDRIADTLHVALSTVRSHIKHINQKLGVSNRAEGKRVAQALLKKEMDSLPDNVFTVRKA